MCLNETVCSFHTNSVMHITVPIVVVLKISKSFVNLRDSCHNYLKSV